VTEPRRLAEFVPHDLPAARIERQWAEVATRVEHERPRSWRWLYASAFALSAMAAVGIAVLVWPSAEETVTSDPIIAGATLEGGEDEVQFELRDGTHIELSAHGRLAVGARDVRSSRMRVERGSARFDVPHREGRSFVVEAKDVEVVVIGTCFSVSVEGEDVRVGVERGIVEVRRAGHPPRRVMAGEEMVLGAEVASAGSVPDVDRPRRPRRPAGEDLWDRATEARRAGRNAEAAEAYSAYVRANPRGRQAALASFELGRLRMDRLDDRAGAMEAFRRAVRLSPSAPFAEDARARIVQAADELGRTAECQRARQSYLDRYPTGVHRAAVERRCPP
jgi:tetratricopeptide (TPR) repeat protein